MRITVNSPDAPAAIGPYSQAVKHNGLLWCSGQLGVVPSTGAFISNDTKGQAEQCLRNLEAVCREAGTNLNKALRCSIFVVDLADFQVVNEIYKSHFEAPYPARVTIQVTALPKGGRVEIDAVVAI